MSKEISDKELLEMADDFCNRLEFSTLDELDEEDQKNSLQMQLVPLLREVAELQRHRSSPSRTRTGTPKHRV